MYSNGIYIVISIVFLICMLMYNYIFDYILLLYRYNRILRNLSIIYFGLSYIVILVK